MKALYLSLKPETPNDDYWDYAIVNDLVSGKLWQPRNFTGYQKHLVDRLSHEKTALVILPARHHKGLEGAVNDELAKIDKVCLFLMGDEEADFDIDQIQHGNILIYVQNAHPDKHDKYRRIGTGYTPKLKEAQAVTGIGKELTAFFSGQITHTRRKEMVEALERYGNGNPTIEINKTRGFTQGYPQEDYYQKMIRAKVVPCPSGAVIPDSFRLFESLECMAIPIADEVNPSGSISGYWDWLFGGNTPFPKIKNWEDLIGYMNDIFRDYPANLHRQTQWWIEYKKRLATEVWEFLNA